MDSLLVLIACESGLAVCGRQDGQWVEVRRGLEDHSLTSVMAREGVILAGSRSGVFRSDDLGETWRQASEGLDELHVRWLAFHPGISDFELAGTEPAGIFISQDGAQTWQACPEVAHMRRQFGWYLPYSPEAGCVRGFALRGTRGYAAVEVGGVLRSEDGGMTWALAAGSTGRPEDRQPPGAIHPDVHSIEVHPQSPDLVYAPTGGGFFRSQDGGRSWADCYPGIYCRAVWVDPRDPERIVLGPADGVDRNGRIERSLDGGRTWQPASTGLEVPWRRHMVERFVQVEDELLAVLSNGDLLSSYRDELAWRQILPEVKGAAAAAFLKV